MKKEIVITHYCGRFIYPFMSNLLFSCLCFSYQLTDPITLQTTQSIVQETGVGPHCPTKQTRTITQNQDLKPRTPAHRDTENVIRDHSLLTTASMTLNALPCIGMPLLYVLHVLLSALFNC